jgi:predicted enzyme related to lactoylglutathione lyase
MAVNDPVVGEIGQIAITVSDVARAKAFYGDVLGLRLLFDAGPNLSFLAARTVRIMLTTPQGADVVGHNSTLYFKVGSADQAYETRGRRGATLEHGAERVATLSDHELWMAFVRDPDGNLVGLMEERPLA